MGLGLLFIYVGGGMAGIAQIWLAVVAFQKGILWGLAVLCIPFVALVFILLNFRESKGALVLYVLGVLLAGAGSGLASPSDRARLFRDRSSARP